MARTMGPSRAMRSEAVLLIGHGRRASDTPADLIAEFRQEAAKPGGPFERYFELDQRIRHWPRTAQTDPYQSGLERIAEALRGEMPQTRVELAFNEFCAPSIDDAIASLVADGVRSVMLISTMFTPGGHHAERDIPAAVAALKIQYPDVVLRYAWPFPLESIARFLAESIEVAESKDRY